MDSIQNNPENYITIGENIHTTRVLLRKGKRIAVEDGQEVILYTAADGSSRQLPIPESVKSTQDYDEGRVKHARAEPSTRIAVFAAANAGCRSGRRWRGGVW